MIYLVRAKVPTAAGSYQPGTPGSLHLPRWNFVPIPVPGEQQGGPSATPDSAGTVPVVSAGAAVPS